MRTKSLKNEGSDRGLIIFIKNPELGKVKTRLAADIGDLKALNIYKQLLAHTRTVTSQSNATNYLYYSNSISDDNWSSDTFRKNLQSGDDLGERMLNAFDEVLKEKSQTVIIGSDCAQLSTEVLNQAFESLNDHDIVIGPTYDGGYYLIGMNSIHPSLFLNMEWSVPDVFDNTLGKIQRLSLSFKVLETLADIDTSEDWEKHGLH